LFGQFFDGVGANLGFEGRPAGTDVVVDLDAKRLQEPPESIGWQQIDQSTEDRPSLDLGGDRVGNVRTRLGWA
jgi:hypothetical protein